MQNQFRLDDLLAREVVPQWFEGIAVVQLVCRQLGGHAPRFPRAEQILIAPGGLITIAGASDDQPVQTAAHVLGLMLGNDVPVRLRLAFTQATATENGFASLAEFSEALAYFERPNPEAIVDAFRQRAIMAAPRAVALPVRNDPSPVPEKNSIPAPASPPRRVSPLTFAAAFAAMVCALVWVVGPRVADALAPKEVVAEKSEPATPPSRSTTKKTNPAAPSSKGENAAGPTRTAPRAQSVTATSKSLLPSPVSVEVVATTVSYAYPTTVPSGSVLESVDTTGTRVFFVDPDEPVGGDSSQEVANRIYSRADPQVTVPLSVYPKFPNDPPGPPTKPQMKLELTIAATGLVERVRLLTEPRNIHEFMLLSAAKAWRFEPARIGDRPVRFRQIMTLNALR